MLLSSCRFKLRSSPSVGRFVERCGLSKFDARRLSYRRVQVRAQSSALTNVDSLTALQKEQVNVYVHTLLEWNQRMNLTAVSDVSQVMERHVQDSLVMLTPIHDTYTSNCCSLDDNINLVDVGTGAGLPGLVLAIARPDWKVTLVESLNKRCTFLDHAVSVMRLSNVEVIRSRAEDLGRNSCFREKFDVAVARAVAEMRILAEYCLPLVRVGGVFVAAKGHDPHVEVENAEKSIHVMGASVLQICSVESHSPYGKRTAVICVKDRPTPKRYPRVPVPR